MNGDLGVECSTLGVDRTETGQVGQSLVLVYVSFLTIK